MSKPGFDPTRFSPEEIEALCRECGARCCYCIPYTHSAIDVAAFVESGDVSMFVDTPEEHERLLEELRFIDENWEQISIVEAHRKATYEIPGWSTEDGASHYYDCRQFDPETLRCKVYDRRPPNCRGFPFYGETDPKKSADYLDCLLVKEARRRLRRWKKKRRASKAKNPR